MAFSSKSYKDSAEEDPPVDDPKYFISLPASLLSVYLVEPKRASSAVLKFTGTLGMHTLALKDGLQP